MSTSTPLPSTPAGKHALVYGGSTAGLIAAGVLSRHFERVTLVERDRLEHGSQFRKGVPQGAHVHGLLTPGMNVLCEVFPGFREELKAAGSHFIDFTGEHAWFMGGFWRPRIPCGLHFYAQSRPLLEWVIRQRLQALPNVHVRDGREVTGFLTSPDKARVTGVHLRVPGGGQEETLEAELVVDASGRGSRTPQWLEALGFPRVEETHIQVDVVYASRLFRRPPGLVADWKMMSIGPKLPTERRMAVLAPIENDQMLLLLAGWHGLQPPLDDAGYVGSTRDLIQPHIHEVMRNAEPLGPINVFRYSHNQRRHYERMSRFPEGLAPVGDAFCSFNPIYGQGMTTGALQARALGESLRQGLGGVAQRYRRQVGQLLESPWTMATSGDLRFPHVEGKRPPAFGLMSWYSDRLQALVGHDEEALNTFVRVMQMVEPTTSLFSPGMVLKVLTSKPTAAAMERKPEPPFAPTAASKNQAA